MDYDQDYSKLNINDKLWYNRGNQRLQQVAFSLEGEDANQPTPTQISLDDEDFK